MQHQSPRPLLWLMVLLQWRCAASAESLWSWKAGDQTWWSPPVSILPVRASPFQKLELWRELERRRQVGLCLANLIEAGKSRTLLQPTLSPLDLLTVEPSEEQKWRSAVEPVWTSLIVAPQLLLLLDRWELDVSVVSWCSSEQSLLGSTMKGLVPFLVMEHS